MRLRLFSVMCGLLAAPAVMAEETPGVAAAAAALVPRIEAEGARDTAPGQAGDAARAEAVQITQTAQSAQSVAALAATQAVAPMLRPQARPAVVPEMRWRHRPEAMLWTRAAMAAVKGHGRPLIEMVPRDIANWCPAYPQAGPEQRSAFWVGFMSALSKHESTYRPDAVGGGGLWYGLLQILPATARGYNCRARTGAALKDGAANLSCAVRIMAVTVARDGVVHGYTTAHARRWRGVSADWGPMRSERKRADMARWLRAQGFCKPLSSLRPVARPAGFKPVRG